MSSPSDPARLAPGGAAEPRAGPRAPAPRLSVIEIAARVLCVLTLLPLAALLVSAFAGSSGAFAQSAAYVLPIAVSTTLALAALVAAGVLAVGVSTAWLVTMCEFPLRRVLSWALVLPLAMPAYVGAYAYTYLLQHPGPVQTLLRDVTGWGPRAYWFPEIRSLGGAAFVLTMVLFPYVYLITRAAFLQQSASAFEASRTLGRGPWRAFVEVAMPLARPAIVAGLALAVMEAMADYGTVAHFGLQTFTTQIYSAWFAMGDRTAAVQLALVLVSFVVLVMALERVGRRGQRFHEARAGRPMVRMELSGWRAAAAFAVCASPVVFGFLLPAATLAALAVAMDVAPWEARMLVLIEHTVSLAAIGAAVTVGVALVIAYARRLSRARLTRTLTRLAGFGYAVPGAVIAVGLLIPFGLADQGLDAFMRRTFGVSTGLVFTGTIVAVVFAYMVRFLAISLNGVEAGLQRIAPSLDGASRSLGAGPVRTLARIHAPLLSGGLLTALLITFVDIMKELPATLILRPFNFETLAIRAYRLASDERLAMASVPSLMIVVVGLVPVILLSRQIARTDGKPRRRAGRDRAPAPLDEAQAASPVPRGTVDP